MQIRFAEEQKRIEAAASNAASRVQNESIGESSNSSGSVSASEPPSKLEVALEATTSSPKSVSPSPPASTAGTPENVIDFLKINSLA